MEIVEMLGAEIIADFCKDLSSKLVDEHNKKILLNIAKASDIAISEKSELMMTYMKHQFSNPAIDDVVKELGYSSWQDALQHHLVSKGGHTSRLTV